MYRKAALFCGLIAGNALLASLAGAATGTSNVTLAATATAAISVLDPSMSLSPSATDYDNGFVEAAGASGLRIRVRTNSSTGLTLSVRCADAAPQITLTDLLVRTLTAPGTGGTSISTYTAITAADQTLWTTTVAQRPWLTVTTDVRIDNLFDYEDAFGGGTTNYTNTLTYTSLAQ